MSKNFELLQRTSSVEELFETAGNPAGLVGTAECEPRPAWSEKPEQRVVTSEALPIHLPDLIREKTSSWGQQVQKRNEERGNDLEAISREEEIKLVQRIFPAGQRSPQIVLFSAVESEAGCASICIERLRYWLVEAMDPSAWLTRTSNRPACIITSA